MHVTLGSLGFGRVLGYACHPGFPRVWKGLRVCTSPWVPYGLEGSYGLGVLGSVLGS